MTFHLETIWLRMFDGDLVCSLEEMPPAVRYLHTNLYRHLDQRRLYSTLL
jgi:hypothetical protein